jgi:hypothetical protein
MEFHKQGGGAGHCAAAPAPVLSVASRAINTALECNTYVRRPGKRARCHRCVSADGVFQTQGAGAGYCQVAAPPPPPTPRWGHVLYSHVGCRANISRPGKQARCLACINNGGSFYMQGAGTGHCYLPTAPSADAWSVDSVPVCASRFATRPGSRGWCIACVSSGGRFLKTAAGAPYCDKPLRYAGTAITTAPECNTLILQPDKRIRCHRCVARAGTFYRQGRHAGYCTRPAWGPGGGIVRTDAACRAWVFPLFRQARCLRCVGRGRAFDMYGPGGGRCIR